MRLFEIARMRYRKSVVIVLICLVAYLAEYAGHLAHWNDRLGDARMSMSQRSASGQIVYVAVDAQSLAAVGNWPWSRSVHAALLDELIASGASDVLFDFDFAFPGDTEGDDAFTAALERAGGATYLAVFEQSALATDPTTEYFNFPLSAFEAYSWPALVNVTTDDQGLVRRYPFGATLRTEHVLSAGALLANALRADEASFEVDFSIDARSIPTFSAFDVLEGRIPAEAVSGRSVVIGASALELSDQLAVPVQGIVAGPLVHVLAAETLMQGRVVGWLRAEWMVLALAAGLILLNRTARFKPIFCIASGIVLLTLVEGIALVVFRTSSVMAPTAMFYPGIACFVVSRLVKSLQTSNWLLLKTSAEARNTLRLLERVFDSGLEGVVILDEDGEVLRFSEPAEDIFGKDGTGRLHLPERLRRAKPQPPEAPLRILEISRDDGSRVIEYRVASSIVEQPTKVGRPPSQKTVVTLTFRDISKLKEQEKDIAYLSNYDDRTGALRRNAYLSFLEYRLAQEQGTIVFALKLDRFKTINMTLGQAVGDSILREVVARLESSSLPLSAPARLGGTSFSVFCESMVDLRDAHKLAMILLEEIGSVYRMRDANAQLDFRIGYKVLNAGEKTTPQTALSKAVEAMDAAKGAGSSIIEFNDTIWEKQKWAREIERAMEAALANNEFHMLYQPQYRISDRKLIGVEALIRWESPILGKVFPDEFIEIAESTGFIVELGNWTLERSAQDALRLPDDTTMSVNVSGVQLMRGDLVADTIRILKRVGLPPDRICFELTETVMIDSQGPTVETMQDLSLLGHTWALDDFGTGFSSMEYLSRMPLSKVKLDKSFVMKLEKDASARPILHASAELCRGLGVKLLCEGVETQRQLDILAAEGCDEAQGYLLSMPLTISQLLELVLEQSAAS